jgi:hypothetical protein
VEVEVHPVDVRKVNECLRFVTVFACLDEAEERANSVGKVTAKANAADGLSTLDFVSMDVNM